MSCHLATRARSLRGARPSLRLVGGSDVENQQEPVLNRAPEAKPLTGRKVLFMLVAFFGVIIGVNLVMMRLAIKTLPGTEVDSAYSASLAYEKEIATAREQAARNWQVDAHVERSGQDGATLQVEARDKSGRPMSGLKFEGRFERPTDRRADLPVTLAEVGIGIYRGSAPAIAPGQWDLVLEGVSAGQRLFLSRNRVLLN
jgi:nitrogen fixation protein FixH